VKVNERDYGRDRKKEREREREGELHEQKVIKIQDKFHARFARIS